MLYQATQNTFKQVPTNPGVLNNWLNHASPTLFIVILQCLLSIYRPILYYILCLLLSHLELTPYISVLFPLSVMSVCLSLSLSLSLCYDFSSSLSSLWILRRTFSSLSSFSPSSLSPWPWLSLRSLSSTDRFIPAMGPSSVTQSTRSASSKRALTFPPLLNHFGTSTLPSAGNDGERKLYRVSSTSSTSKGVPWEYGTRTGERESGRRLLRRRRCVKYRDTCETGMNGVW